MPTVNKKIGNIWRSCQCANKRIVVSSTGILSFNGLGARNNHTAETLLSNMRIMDHRIQHVNSVRSSYVYLSSLEKKRENKM